MLEVEDVANMALYVESDEARSGTMTWTSNYPWELRLNLLPVCCITTTRHLNISATSPKKHQDN